MVIANETLFARWATHHFFEPHFEEVPMKILKPQVGKDDVQYVSYPMLDPHVWFAWLYNNKKGEFAKQYLDGDW